MTLIEKMTAYGADMKETMNRFLNDEKFYETCLEMFFKGEEFSQLKTAIDNKEYKQAFEIAHTIKGVVGNLGLTPLYNAVCEIVEPLRAKDYSNLELQYNAIIAEKLRLEEYYKC